MNQIDPDSQLNGRTIVLGITGSIAAYKSAELVSKLKQRGGEVITILTAAAGEFITPLTFETLSGNKAYTKLFKEEQQYDPLHISLSQKADILTIAPATANFIGKMAAGIADDLLSSVVMATRATILVAPAMNTAMYKNMILQANIQKLVDIGINFVGPEFGYLACGKTGEGRMASVDKIIEKIEALLGQAPRVTDCS